MKGLRQRLTLLVWCVAIWAFFQFCYEYTFYYKEQNQLFLLSWDYVQTYFSRPAWASLLAGDFLTQYFYYQYAGAAIFAVTLFLTGDMLATALRRMGVNGVVATVAALVVTALLAVFNFSPDYRLSSVMALTGTLLLLLLWTLLLRCRLWIKVAGGVVGLLLAWRLFAFGTPCWGTLSTPYFQLEDYLAADNLYYFGKYDKLTERVEAMDEKEVTPVISSYYYMAQVRRGLLLQSLGKVKPVSLGTLHRLGPNSTIQEIKMMSELYFLLGDMTMAERAAMIGCVSSPDNRNVRMIRRLAEVNLVAGDDEAAMKYLRILEKTAVYSRWARANRPGHINITLETKKKFVNTTDRLRTSDDCRDAIIGLLESNPRNRIALNYLLCTDILVGGGSLFAEDYKKYYLPVYGEAHEHLYRKTLRGYYGRKKKKE